MRLNPINFAVATGISALLAFGFWSLGGPLSHFIAVGAFVFLSGTLIPTMGLEFELPRRAVNLKIVCFVFLVIGLVINGVFSALDFSSTAYVITSTVVFLLYVFIANAIYSAKQ